MHVLNQFKLGVTVHSLSFLKSNKLQFIWLCLLLEYAGVGVCQQNVNAVETVWSLSERPVILNVPFKS